MLVPVIWKHEARPQIWTEQSVVTSGTIDKPSISSNGSSAKRELNRAEQYKIVGQALCCSEATYLRVGVPWLPATERVQQLKCEKDLRPNEFIREELVTVSTQVLEAYCDDLETIGRDGVGMDGLGLSLGSWFEKYGFAILLAAAVLVSGLFSSSYVMQNSLLAIIMSLFLASVGGAMGAYLGTDSARRCSFHMLLSQEVLRRNGAGTGSVRGSKVHANPVGSFSDTSS